MSDNERTPEVEEYELDPFEVEMTPSGAPVLPGEPAEEDLAQDSPAATEQPAEETEEVQSTEEVDSKIPEKFRGKSMEDVLESYQELERRFGQRNQEHGQLRKLTDQLLQRAELGTPQQAEPPAHEPVTADDIMDAPEETINRLIEGNPTLAGLSKTLQETKEEKAQSALKARHEDWNDIMNSEEFAEYVQKSPIRLRMLQEAHTKFDVDIADELLTNYKTTQQILATQANAARDSKAGEALKANGSVESNSSTNAPAGKVTQKPWFSRQKLLKLQIEDYAKYVALQPQIMEAYAEGRVRD